MSKPISRSQLKDKVTQAIQHEKHFLEATKGSENPQVIEMRVRTEGELVAMEAVWEALRGNNVFLNCLTGR